MNNARFAEWGVMMAAVTFLYLFMTYVGKVTEHPLAHTIAAVYAVLTAVLLILFCVEFLRPKKNVTAEPVKRRRISIREYAALQYSQR